MNIIAELSEVWDASNRSASDGTDGPVSNPLPYFEKASRVIQAAITQACKARNCTFAEFLEETRKVEPGIIERYFELFDTMDCDVYGRWCVGVLTYGEHRRFCRAVDDWQEAAMRMIQVRQKGEHHG